MKQRILVLGAGGFIGRRVIESLAADPTTQAVAAIHRSRPPAFPPAVEVITLDAANGDDLQDVLGKFSAVVNCVAGGERSIVGGARALAAIAGMRGDTLQVVHLSSLAVYGNATGTVDESAPLRGDLDDYSAAKVAAEIALGGLRSVVILRPGIVYGPGSTLWSRFIGRLLIAGRLRDLGTAGDGICNLIYIDDVVTAIRRCLTMPAAAGAFNLAASHPPTWNEYFRRYAAALQAAPVPPMSRMRLAVETRIISPALKIAELFAGARAQDLPPAIRPWLLARCRHQLTMDAGRAENTLHMSWRPLDAGMQATAKWFRDEVGA
jgi:nucleoside-diphosphate-sugar epimerase